LILLLLGTAAGAHTSPMPRLLTLILLLATATASTAQPETDMPRRLAACNACHGERGEGKVGNEYYPHLAGKPAGYLRSQLQAFRDRRRAYPQMNWLMRNMGDAYLDQIASYYAALPPRSSAERVAMTSDDADRARELVERGDPDRGVPACSACHGADLAGLEPAVPALLGLPPDYTIAQLGAWRTGARTATAPDCMAAVARALDPRDLRRLGEWLASQGASHSLKPSPAGSFVLPVPCGLVPTGEVWP
jgi:cytochrome c553